MSTVAEHQSKAEHLRKLISTYAMRSGEEFKRGLPTIVREAYTTECWREAMRPDGQPFASFYEWLTTPPPPGCGLGCTSDAITYAELLAVCEKGAADVAKILAEEQKKATPGRKKANAAIADARPQLDRHNSKLRSTLSVRLAQEHPSHYQAYLDGKHKSVRAAAEAAGLVKPGHDPVMRVKAYYRKLTKAQRKEITKWIAELNGE